MPTYHFSCSACGHEFSEQLPMGTSTLPACTVCAKTTNVTKIMRPPMIHFKGTGFYKTDSLPAAKPKTEAKPASPQPSVPTPTLSPTPSPAPKVP